MNAAEALKLSLSSLATTVIEPYKKRIDERVLKRQHNGVRDQSRILTSNLILPLMTGILPILENRKNWKNITRVKVLLGLTIQIQIQDILVQALT